MYLIAFLWRWNAWNISIHTFMIVWYIVYDIHAIVYTQPFGGVMFGWWCAHTKYGIRNTYYYYSWRNFFLTHIDEAMNDNATVNTNVEFHVRQHTTNDNRWIEHIKIGHTVTKNLRTSSDAYRRHSDSFGFGLLRISFQFIHHSNNKRRIILFMYLITVNSVQFIWARKFWWFRML